MGIDGISKSQVSELAKFLDEVVSAFRHRPLDASPDTYIWVDALDPQRCARADASSMWRSSWPPG